MKLAVGLLLLLATLCPAVADLTSASISNASSPDTNVHAYTSGSAIDRRIEMERRSRNNPFVLIPHRTTYILPFSYTRTVNQDPFTQFGGKMSSMEIKGQISFKLQLARNLIGNNGYIYTAYTQQVHWQAYSTSLSTPFRDTNHEPEIFFTLLTDRNIFNVRARVWNMGINHQSNGRSGLLSRSWNRIFTEFIFEAGHYYFSVRPWWRIPEGKKQDPLQSAGDDNPEIDDFMGYGEFLALYELRMHRLGMMVRNNFRSENRGAIQLDWSFPIKGRMRGYIQYFNGYGENLLDYNARNNRISAGFMIADWL